MFKNFKKEFGAFIMRGNVMDLAIGMVIGAAFSAIVNSLVKDIINPILGLLTSGIDFSDLKIVLKDAVEETPELAIRYGALFNAILSFLIISLVIFMVIKAINKFKKPVEEKPVEPTPVEPTEKEILTEILSVLKSK